MSDMLAYSVSMLTAINDFLLAPPMIYVLGFIVLAFTLKLFVSLIKI